MNHAILREEEDAATEFPSILKLLIKKIHITGNNPLIRQRWYDVMTLRPPPLPKNEADAREFALVLGQQKVPIIWRRSGRTFLYRQQTAVGRLQQRQNRTATFVRHRKVAAEHTADRNVSALQRHGVAGHGVLALCIFWGPFIGKIARNRDKTGAGRWL